MIGILFLLLLAIPIVELYVIVQVAQEIGVLTAVGALIGISVAGAWLLKQQGVATWRRLQASMARGEIPTKEVTDGALILLGGALLLTPGFVTDAVGLLLLLPPTRAWIKGAARRSLGRMAKRRAGVAWTAGGRVYDTYAQPKRGTERPGAKPVLEESPPPADGDDSPGRG